MKMNNERIQPYNEEHANFIIDVQGILEALHQSGLAFELICDGGGPIIVKLADPTGSDLWRPNAADPPLTVATAVSWLRDKACEHYPDTRFARKYRNQVERFGNIHTPGTRWARTCGCTCPADQPRATYGALIDPRCPAHGFT